MATKTKATRSTKKATKPVRKPAAKKVAAKTVKAKKAVPRPKKAAAKPKPKAKAPAARKVTARKPTGKMVRPSSAKAKPAKAPRPAHKRQAERAAAARPGTPPRKASPAAKPRRAPRVEERRALPHKAPSRPAFQMNDYFDGNASPYPTLPPSRREILPVAVEWKEKMRPGELYQAFKRFFEANELGNRFIGPLREGAAAIVEFEGDPQSYKVVKVRGRALMELGRPASAEVYLKLSRHAVESMLAPNATKPAEYVGRLVALMAEPDPSKRIELKLLCTHGEAIRKGYLGVVASGGKQLAEALLQLGHSLPHEFVKHLH